jgi:hypothetical protein
MPSQNQAATLITSGPEGTLIEPGTWSGLFCKFLVGHRWEFHHESNPAVVICARCGRVESMPFGDRRMFYL